MSNVNTKNNVRTIAVTGMLSAVAVVLMYLEIPIPIMPGFIKFDFSIFRRYLVLMHSDQLQAL